MASAVTSSSFQCLSASRSVSSASGSNSHGTRVSFHKPRPVSAVYAAAPVAAAASTLYDVLGIQSEATCQEIKSAYRRLARVLHPDVVVPTNNGGNDVASVEDFIRVHEAYATLSDPGKRADYDRALFIRRRLGNVSQFVGDLSGQGSARGPSASRFSRRSWETDQCW